MTIQYCTIYSLSLHTLALSLHILGTGIVSVAPITKIADFLINQYLVADNSLTDPIYTLILAPMFIPITCTVKKS